MLHGKETLFTLSFGKGKCFDRTKWSRRVTPGWHESWCVQKRTLALARREHCFLCQGDTCSHTKTTPTLLTSVFRDVHPLRLSYEAKAWCYFLTASMIVVASTTAIRTLWDDRWNRRNICVVSSFTKLNKLPESIKADKRIFPKITAVIPKDKHSGTRCKVHKAGVFTQVHVFLVVNIDAVYFLWPKTKTSET